MAMPLVWQPRPARQSLAARGLVGRAGWPGVTRQRFRMNGRPKRWPIINRLSQQCKRDHVSSPRRRHCQYPYGRRMHPEYRSSKTLHPSAWPWACGGALGLGGRDQALVPPAALPHKWG